MLLPTLKIILAVAGVSRMAVVPVAERHFAIKLLLLIKVIMMMNIVIMILIIVTMMIMVTWSHLRDPLGPSF